MVILVKYIQLFNVNKDGDVLQFSDCLTIYLYMILDKTRHVLKGHSGV